MREGTRGVSKAAATLVLSLKWLCIWTTTKKARENEIIISNATVTDVCIHYVEKYHKQVLLKVDKQAVTKLFLRSWDTNLCFMAFRDSKEGWENDGSHKNHYLYISVSINVYYVSRHIIIHSRVIRTHWQI